VNCLILGNSVKESQN